jgi:hypothetical protein
LAIERAARAKRSDALLRALALGQRPRRAAIQRWVSASYERTQLADVETRIRWFRTATVSELKRVNDPLIRAALALRPLYKQWSAQHEGEQGVSLLARARYVRALRAAAPAPLSPDANGTLRVTVGTVGGYRSPVDGGWREAFTTVASALDKHTGTAPFALPAPWLEASRRRHETAYRDAVLSDVPVNFLSNCDITGGNSGSATLDADGNLVGIVFDGTYESLASDWRYDPEVTRAIHVDARYMLWVLGEVDGAQHLLEELRGRVR